MGFCLECGEVTAQQLCFECFSRFDILEADAEFEEYTAYLMKTNSGNNQEKNQEPGEEE